MEEKSFERGMQEFINGDKCFIAIMKDKRVATEHTLYRWAATYMEKLRAGRVAGLAVMVADGLHE